MHAGGYALIAIFSAAFLGIIIYVVFKIRRKRKSIVINTQGHSAKIKAIMKNKYKVKYIRKSVNAKETEKLEKEGPEKVEIFY